MARSEVRALILAIAGFGVLTNTVGAYFAIQTGTSLSAWQLNCLGVGLPTAVVGTLAAWHQPRNRIAWLFLSATVGFGLEQLGLAVLAYPTSASWAQAAAYGVLLVTPGPLTTIWVLLVLLFPDGRFSRPRWRLYALIALAVAVIASVVEFLIAPAGYLPLEYGAAAPARLAGPFATFSTGLPLAGLDLPGVLLPALALLALLDRYRHAHGTVRQQIKWLLFAVSLQVAILVLFFPLLWLGVEEPAPVSLLVAPLPTIGAALAIFKYRLWEVDRLLLRTVVFAAFWLVSSAGFLGVAAVAGLAIGGMDLRLLAAVTLSLLAALALQPIRGRLEARIRLLVYGPRPRGYTALARLGEREQLPGALPVGRLAELIAAVARDAVGVDWTSVWLRMEVDKRFLLRLVGEARAEPACESDSARVELEWWGDRDQVEPASLASLLPQPAGVVLPLETATELVGFLACGQRDARELSADDHQVLAVIARQAAVLLRHGRLEEELRERLDELRESRQRLVTSQDEQRRRLERDLHDGVQQQLVSLAARMRQLSRLGSASRPAELESLADQAEEAVFAMQDLARGIYPSVLADQGLAAALRAQAARLPLELRLDVEPGLAHARFEGDSEACLYFVAMEALTNAQKHASCSAVTVSMRSRAQPRGLVLEVHDNGRGFTSTAVSERRHSGSGLQNMRDRLAALGGQLDVRSAPGAGTWIVANLPVSAEILPFQRPGIVSRR